MNVSDLLHAHRHPLTLAAIAQECGISRREAEAEVQRLRLEGLPLCSGSDGLWLSQDPAEIARCADRLRRRAGHQLLTARSLRRTARRMGQDLTLWDAA